jgi:hypothetical protein
MWMTTSSMTVEHWNGRIIRPFLFPALIGKASPILKVVDWSSTRVKDPGLLNSSCSGGQCARPDDFMHQTVFHWTTPSQVHPNPPIAQHSRRLWPKADKRHTGEGRVRPLSGCVSHFIIQVISPRAYNWDISSSSFMLDESCQANQSLIAGPQMQSDPAQTALFISNHLRVRLLHSESHGGCTMHVVVANAVSCPDPCARPGGSEQSTLAMKLSSVARPRHRENILALTLSWP